MKVCNRCGRELPLSDFYPDKSKKDGVSTMCRGCIRMAALIRYNSSEYHKDVVKRRIERYGDDSKPAVEAAVGMKQRCIDCHRWFPATPEYFYRNRCKPLGLNNTCKACAKERSAKWREEKRKAIV